jgi:predicted transcriptional regulator
MDENNDDLIVLTTDIVSSYVANNAIQGADIPALIGSVHTALVEAEAGKGQPAKQEYEPVVSVKASIKPDHLVCLACGAKQKILKRHIKASHGLSPAEYKDRYNLPSDYPMVAAVYAKRRSKLAKKIGLGRKRAG